jgi:nucleoside-diphosphate-sugar epimerase
MIQLLNKFLGKNMKPVFLDPQPGDIFKSYSDISMARKRLGYKPVIGFESGLQKTLQYFQSKSQLK